MPKPSVEIQTKDRHTPPAGYEIIQEGKVRRTDLVWNVYDKHWNHPSNEDYSLFGSNITGGWYSVARKM